MQCCLRVYRPIWLSSYRTNLRRIRLVDTDRCDMVTISSLLNGEAMCTVECAMERTPGPAHRWRLDQYQHLVKSSSDAIGCVGTVGVSYSRNKTKLCGHSSESKQDSIPQMTRNGPQGHRASSCHHELFPSKICQKNTVNPASWNSRKRERRMQIDWCEVNNCLVVILSYLPGKNELLKAMMECYAADSQDPRNDRPDTHSFWAFF